MKSFRIFLIALFSLICTGLNGQVFVGGGFSFNSGNNKTEEFGTDTRKMSNYNFSLSPEAGLFLSEKAAIGLELGFSLHGSSSVNATETTTKASSFGINPFVRYYALKWNKFSLYGEAKAGLSFSGSSRTTAGITDEEPDETRISLNVFPGLSYDISEKLALETSLNFLSLGYYYEISKEGTTKYKSSGFNAGAGFNNIVAVNGIVIGAIYKF